MTEQRLRSKIQGFRVDVDDHNLQSKAHIDLKTSELATGSDSAEVNKIFQEKEAMLAKQRENLELIKSSIDSLASELTEMKKDYRYSKKI